jgi:hypothetical protein
MFPQTELLICTSTPLSRKCNEQETYTFYGKMLVPNFYDFFGGKISEVGISYATFTVLQKVMAIICVH